VIDTFELFHVDQPPPPPREKLSPDRRRTERQAEVIAERRHPLSLTPGAPDGLGLHPDASTDRDGPGPRCGNCRFRDVLRYHNRTYAKCTFVPGSMSADAYARNGPPRVSHGAGSDVRAWWPACLDFELGDRFVDWPDAARCAPEAAS